MKKRFRVLKDGETFAVKASGEVIHFACCDCNLVHDISFYYEDGHVGISMRRNKALTKLRRTKKAA